ncbi:MAG: LysM peptidoglycan-binding domain-containing protein [Gammaproteobacteria bacterium]
MPDTTIINRTVVLLGLCAALAACALPRGIPEPAPAATADVPVAAPTLAEPAPEPVTTAITVATEALTDFYALPEAPPDLLRGLAEEFSMKRQPEQARVAAEARWYAKHPAYLERVFTRARPYLPHIAAEVRARGMPTELALLPVVESAFDPFAYSHGRAAGLWQIIPGTGRRFGLKQNWWYDGRRDVVESTRAALDYLEYLANRYDGDWQLAVAAYNSGEGNVDRAIRRNRAAGRPTDFWHLRLPRETRAYVPRLMGLSEVVRAPEAFGVTLPELPDTPYFAEVALDGQVDLALAAELAGLEVEELYSLNPGFNRWATDPDGPHRLQVPVESAPVLAEALASVPESERVRWERHRVAQGDTLSELARTYRTTPAVIREVNGLSGNVIRAGSWLMVPTATRSLGDYSLSAGNRLAAKQNRERPGRSKRTHTVRSGESLWTISRRYGVGVRELAAWNGMAPGDTLSVGRELVIWSRSSAPAATTLADDTRVRKVRYTVRRGDSLSRIATNFRVTVTQLKDWNNLHDQRYLQPGQRLVMYVDITAQSGG